ncbi:PaaI family thioesterase [Pseudonocardia ailaonensis]|uniref:PaaI family thioesterase n=1 Tax=Pseudonocardia ailaonensis TaxID=367279 RepID=A0ABN2NGU1_9PSEU
MTAEISTDPEAAAVVAFAADMRRALDAIAWSRPPVQVWQQAAALARDLARLAEAYPIADPADRVVGRVGGVPGRGQNLVPPMRRLHVSATEVEAEVVLDRTHLGNGGAHGGVAPLMFDELLGNLANLGAARLARTAYLHVDYRAVMPIGVPVRLSGRVARVSGRKRFLVGAASLGEQVFVEVEGLFVELRPGAEPDLHLPVDSSAGKTTY